MSMKSLMCNESMFKMVQNVMKMCKVQRAQVRASVSKNPLTVAMAKVTCRCSQSLDWRL